MQKADDWQFLADHCVQIGTAKAFVTTGIRLSDYQKLDRALKVEDLTLLGLDLMGQSNKQAVLQGTYGISAGAYVSDAARRGDDYSGFNLLAEDGDELWWCSNRGGEPRRLEAGVYGLGNFLLDTPEVGEAKRQLACAIESAPSVEPLFGVLAAARIVAPAYGTRSSTVLIRSGDHRLQFAERAYDPAGVELDTIRFEPGPTVRSERRIA